MSADRHLWVVDRTSSKTVAYDPFGRFLYSWGVGGEFPGGSRRVHQAQADQEGNPYTAELNAGLFQEYRSRRRANSAVLMGAPQARLAGGVVGIMSPGVGISP